jgi:hypothetical protein
VRKQDLEDLSDHFALSLACDFRHRQRLRLLDRWREDVRCGCPLADLLSISSLIPPSWLRDHLDDRESADSSRCDDFDDLACYVAEQRTADRRLC